MEGTEKVEKYKSFNGKTEADITAYFNGRGTHCVSCKVDLPDACAISYPISNSLSISIGNAEDQIKYAVPALVCSACQYNNTILKLLSQT